MSIKESRLVNKICKAQHLVLYKLGFRDYRRAHKPIIRKGLLRCSKQHRTQLSSKQVVFGMPMKEPKVPWQLRQRWIAVECSINLRFAKKISASVNLYAVTITNILTQVATYSSGIGYMGEFWVGSYWLILVATTNKTTFSSNPCGVTAWIERGNNLSIKLAVVSTDLR